MRSWGTATVRGDVSYRAAPQARRRSLIALLALATVVGLLGWAAPARAANEVAAENALTGTSAWKLTNPATNREVEGYMSATSVNRGGTISLRARTSSTTTVTLEVFRMGWYQGLGARRVLGPVTFTGMNRTTPTPNATTGLVEANWPVSYTITTSTGGTPWATGVYLGRMTTSAGKQSYVIFVVRDDAQRPDILFQLPVTTYQAYNYWGGKSLYNWGSGSSLPWGTSSGTPATKVSFERPYAKSNNAAAAYGMGAGEFLTNVQQATETSSAGWDYNMVRWMEKEGYDVGYITNIDTHESAARILNTNVFLSQGHDEYWTWQMRDNVEAARDAGVDEAFFSGNTSYWQIRLEKSPVTGSSDRVIVCYKYNATDPVTTDADPSNDDYETVRFRDVGRPEAAMKGTQYGQDPVDGDIVVTNASHWAFAGTGLSNGDHIPGLLGYEVDGTDWGTPANIVLLTRSPVGTDPEPSSQMSVYQAPSGAQVFASGTIQWSWGLDDYNAPALRTSRLSAAAATITRNVFRTLLDQTPPETTMDSGPTGTTGATSATVGFSSEAFATFECRLDGGAWAACTSPKTYLGLADGQHTVDVRATDTAGNVDPTPATRTWTVDLTPPDTTITSGPPSTTNATSASFGFSSEAGATFECRLDGGAWTSCTAPKAYSGLTAGQHTVSVRATDAVGNTDPTPATRTWTVDLTPPDTTITSGPSGPVNTTTLTFGFSSEAGATFECQLDGGAWSACSNPATFSGLAEVQHTLYVRAVDTAGNPDPSPATRTFTVDATPPDTTIGTGPSGVVKATSAVFTFSSEPGASFACQADAGAWTPCTSPVALSGLAEGAHTFQVRASDALGNTDPTPATRTWTVDTTPPDTTLDSGPSGTTNATGATVTFSSEAGATFECQLDAGAWASCTSPKTYTGLADGQHTVKVRATDPAGNTDPTPAGRTWTVDTIAPDTTITSGPADPSSSTGATVAFSSEAGATFQCRLDNGAWSACTSPKSYTGLADGQHTVDVRATDTAGNVDPTPATRTWTVDTVAPDTTITSGPVDPSNSTGALISFSSEAGATFQCRLDNGAWSACTSPKSYTGLTDGQHTVDVRATDPAGNTDPTPAGRTWTVDTIAPDTTITSGPSGPWGAAAATFGFSSEAGATFECQLDGGAWTACTSPATATGLSETAHTFRVRATDLAGNTDASPASRSFTVDTTPPDTTLSSGPSGAVNTAAATFAFAAEAGATFECRLDGGAWAACTSPKAYTGLAEAQHTFDVRAVDAAGNPDPTPASRTWTVDTTPPDTSMDAGPSGPWGSTTAAFSFSSEAGAGFECQLDAGAWTPCTSPKTYTGLSEAQHTVKVRAVDAAGNADPTPASRTFTVDVTPPDTTLVAGPSGPWGSTTAAFSFSAEAGATFECQLDAGAWTSCTSPKTYTGLSEAQHTVKVRAVDAAGNTDPTPASRTFTVDVTPPDTTLDAGPSGPWGSTTATLVFSSEAGATFECRLDGGAWAACTSPKAYTGLGEGDHTAQVRALDPAGNADPTPASRTFTVDVTAPDTTLDAGPSGPWGSTTAAFSFSSEAGAGFECQLDAGAWAACASPKTYTGLSEAQHTVKVRAVDAAGNTDPTPASRTFTVDVTPPDTTIGSGPANPSASANATFAFSSEAGAAFQCRLDGSGWASCASPRSLTALSEGDHTFEVRAVDPAGNPDPTPASRTWTVDTTPPDTSMDAGPSGPWGSTTAAFSFSSEAGAGFECQLDAGAWTSCTSPKTYTGLSEAQHTVKVRAVDAAGNTDPTPASRTFTVDVTPPDTTIGSGPSGPWSSTTATFSFSAEAGAGFECQLDGGAWTPCASPKTYAGLSEAQHTVKVRATDPAGNTDPTPASRSFTVDTTPPDTTLDSGPSGTTNATGATVAFSSEAGATFQCRLDSGAWSACTSPKSYTGLTDGQHTVDVRATDPAGNTDPTPAGRTWTVDTTPPATTINNGPSGPVNSAAASFAFSSEAGATFECRLDGGAWSACTSPRSYTGLSEAPHTFDVRATDAAGNTDPSPASRSFTVDTTPPDTTIDDGPSGPAPATGATFTFSSEAGASFECRLDGGAWTPCASPRTDTGLTEGEHAFDVRAVDAAGNVDPTPASRTFAVDTTPPDTTLDTGPSGTSGSAAAAFAFSGEAGATFECRLDDGPWSACTSPADRTGLSDGGHTFDVRAVDTAGNPDPTPASRTWTVDTTPPSTTIESGPPGPTATSGATFAFSSEAGATFACRLDGGAWAPCTSPEALTGLSEGRHTFDVRATDPVGNTEPAPASRTWTVDTTPPDTTITTGPADPSSSSSAELGFSSEPGATFECRIDEGPWGACASPASFAGLGDGAHTAEVRARDAAGNADPTPASRTWTVAVAAPSGVVSPATTSGASGLTLTLSAPRQRLAQVLGRGISARLGCSGACTVKVMASLDAATARRLKLPRRLAAGTVTLKRAGTRAVRLRVGRTAKARLRARRTLRVSLAATATGGGGRAATLRRSLTYRAGR